MKQDNTPLGPAAEELMEAHRRLFRSEKVTTPSWFEQATGFDRCDMPVPGVSIADLEKNIAELERRSR